MEPAVAGGLGGEACVLHQSVEDRGQETEARVGEAEAGAVNAQRPAGEPGAAACTWESLASEERYYGWGNLNAAKVYGAVPTVTVAFT